MAKKYTFALSSSKNPNMILFVTYVLLFVVNAVLISSANLVFPQQVVLGTVSISPAWAVVLSMGAVSLIGTFAMPFVRELELWRDRKFSPQDWMLSYFVINFIALWLVSRFAEQFGLGISAWYVVAILAALFDFVQGLVMMNLGRFIEE